MKCLRSKKRKSALLITTSSPLGQEGWSGGRTPPVCSASGRHVPGGFVHVRQFSSAGSSTHAAGRRDARFAVLVSDLEAPSQKDRHRDIDDYTRVVFLRHNQYPCFASVAFVMLFTDSDSTPLSVRTARRKATLTIRRCLSLQSMPLGWWWCLLFVYLFLRSKKIGSKLHSEV